MYWLLAIFYINKNNLYWPEFEFFVFWLEKIGHNFMHYGILTLYHDTDYHVSWYLSKKQTKKQGISIVLLKKTMVLFVHVVTLSCIEHYRSGFQQFLPSSRNSQPFP